MKNKEVLKVIELLGTIGVNTQLVVLHNDKELGIGAIMVTEKGIYVCIDDEICLSANNYFDYIIDESKYSANIQELMNLEVKAFVGDILTETPMKSNKLRDIRSIKYHDNKFLFKI